MITMHISVDDETAGMLRTGAKNMRPDIKKAVNELAVKTRDHIYREERRKYVLKASDYKKSDLKIKKATNGRLEAEIRSEGGVLSLKGHYRVRANGKWTAAKAMVLKRTGTPKKLTKYGNKGFTATVSALSKGGEEKSHTGIFVRQTKKRLHIEEFFGPGAGKITQKVFEPMEEETGTMLKDRVNALIAFGGGR